MEYLNDLLKQLTKGSGHLRMICKARALDMIEIMTVEESGKGEENRAMNRGKGDGLEQLVESNKSGYSRNGSASVVFD